MASKLKNTLLSIPILICISMAALSSCTGSMRQIEMLRELQDTLQIVYPSEKLNIQVNNGTHISVIFNNSTYNDSSDAVKQKLAEDIGQITFALYSDNGIEGGKVVFVKTKNFFIGKSQETQSFSMNMDNLSSATEADSTLTDSLATDTL